MGLRAQGFKGVADANFRVLERFTLDEHGGSICRRRILRIGLWRLLLLRS